MERVGGVRGIIAEKIVVSTAVDPFLNLTALVEYTSLSKRTLQDLINDVTDPLPTYVVGRRLLFRVSEVDARLLRHRSRRHKTDIASLVNGVLSDPRRWSPRPRSPKVPPGAQAPTR